MRNFARAAPVCGGGGRGKDLGIVSSGIHSRGVSGVASGMAGASAGDTFRSGSVDGTSARSVLPVGGRVHSGDAGTRFASHRNSG